MEIKHRYLLPFLLALLLTSVHAQNIQNDSLLDGYLSYQKGDWTNAAFFLRKAATDPSVSNDSVWYMIIMSEMNMEKFSNALSDCNYFMQTFNDSSLLPNVKYQRGRILHYVGQNDNAVLELSDFCHENPESPVYSSALFWIAECFYEDYSFETAKTLYERVVSEFPESSKVEDSLFKISLINQREREEKLLYLLKLTGEEYLSARETYEKQLRIYQTEDAKELRKQLAQARERILELEYNAANNMTYSQSGPVVESVSSENTRNEAVPESKTDGNTSKASKGPVSDEEIFTLKQKAALIQKLLDSKYQGK
ncbi:MAG: tetratricopeptide repeat protein [Treponema sp.]|nr:tetratricopeptide repeat protein [Spirochaetia bacterium]MDY3758333.1 tetratricopeptide repeat protein [Treponema sp.]